MRSSAKQQLNKSNNGLEDRSAKNTFYSSRMQTDMRYDNIRPASPAMTRGILALHRAFSNPWGRQKAKAREICTLGPRSQTARERYGDIAHEMAKQQFNVHDAILHLRFFRRIEKGKIAPNRYHLARHLEAMILLRWLRRYKPHAYYPFRDALLDTSTIMPRSW
jgi:hypothetical protein